MTSRLDRLFVLLETGSAGTTRRAAARQLGDVQRAHPADLQRLLARLTHYLRSPAWETRIAAGQAVEAVLSNVPEWNPIPCDDIKDEDIPPDPGCLSFETFDIEGVLERGAFLMASEGKEYDIDDESKLMVHTGTDIRERLARQRQMLNARLRFGPLVKMEIDLGDLITNEDLLPDTSRKSVSRQSSQTDPPNEFSRLPVTELMRQQLEHNYPHPQTLSSREMNRAKRKARQAALVKQRSHEEDSTTGGTSSFDASSASDSMTSSLDEPDKKKIRLEKFDDGFGNGFPLPDGTWPLEVISWPFESWFCWLTSQLFSASWEARHGAATAIRETLKKHGRGVGKERGMTKAQMDKAHQCWLEDTCVRLVCVLGLDRFGDFVSDQVVAPVRESCAQALGVACELLSSEGAVAATRALARLAVHRHWEARHGGTLGYKYIAAARDDIDVQTTALKAALRALRDPAEDVGAAAAGALAGCADSLCRRLPRRVPSAVAALWRLLRRHDDLAAAASHAHMVLLAALLAAASQHCLMGPVPLKKVLPRLWPYLSHPTSSVRKAALQTLRTLTQLSIAREDYHHHKSPKENGSSNEAASLSEQIENKDNGLVMKTDSTNLNLGFTQDEVFDDESSEISDASGEEDNVVVERESDRPLNETSQEDTTQWSPNLLQVALRHVFQRVLVEHVPEIQDIAEMVWEDLIIASSLSTLLIATCPIVSTWLCLTMQPPRLPFDSTMLLHARPLKERHSRPPSQSDNPDVNSLARVELQQQKWYIGGSESVPASVREGNLIRARSKAANMLGLLSCYIVKPAPGIDYTSEDESPIDCYVRVLSVYLSSCGSLQRLAVALVVASWARRSPPKPQPQLLVTRLHHALTVPVYYDEVAATCNRILQDAKDFISTMKHYKMSILGEQWNNISSLDQVLHLTGSQGLAKSTIEMSKLKNRITLMLHSRRSSINMSALQCEQEYNSYNISTLAALAAACANLSALPDKLNPVIKPLMESIKKESEEILQQISAAALAVLLSQCVDRDPCPNTKVLMNLRTFLCCDPETTPRVTDTCQPSSSTKDESGESSNDNSNHQINFRSDILSGILTLSQQQRQAERVSFRRSQSNSSTNCGSGTNVVGGSTTPGPPSRGPGRPPISDNAMDDLLAIDDENHKNLLTQRRGASYALMNLVTHFGEELPEKLPKLWEFISAPFLYDENAEIENPNGAAEELILNLQVLETVASSLDKNLLPNLLGSVEAGALAVLPALLRHAYTAVRHMAARCTAALAAIAPQLLMQMIVDKVVCMLEEDCCSRRRQGASETLACVVDKLQINIVPYIVLLVVPLLRRMSDQDKCVRLTSTHCFATLIQLMPLEGASEPPGLLPAALSERRNVNRDFLYQLFNTKLIPDYKLPIPINAELREYQQAGVNWLSFLNRYGLHGVLCDDMGLGKTLQSICVVAGDHYVRRKKSPKATDIPSLVICPQTLTGHWVYEVRKFLSKKYLNPLQYSGPPFEREKLRTKLKYYNLIVASYDIVRKDIDFFSSIKWNYCILDEGHIIKNGKTKASKAIKTIMANNRLILSGTPIQNNVLELWSLFDFLMPGLLGTERQFTIKYSRPILAARDSRATHHHQEAGALAMEALHRQVLPFLLRRMKEDVLTELPPKITQDYYCDLSSLQRRLYEDFAKVHMPDDMNVDLDTQGHIFQALRYLQNVCNHPKLVLTIQHPQFSSITKELASHNTNLSDIQHSAKLPALMQLLQDCGIGCTPAETSAVVSQHRALIFCQLRSMLDIVEFDLLKARLPSVSYLRLDGRVPPSARHQVVHRFNTDPSIDVLLLTTQVGGLGLNLTGADTVIFVEHDWNPMKDLQAMDRAHRIGQKRVVNVYRLITRNTLEERIMGLQKFKLLTANTVISSENASLETMGTDKLLDLFNVSDNTQCSTSSVQLNSTQPPAQKKVGKMTMTTVLENLPDLWDDKQYEEEYDMASFIQKLKK